MFSGEEVVVVLLIVWVECGLVYVCVDWVLVMLGEGDFFGFDQCEMLQLKFRLFGGVVDV